MATPAKALAVCDNRPTMWKRIFGWIREALGSAIWDTAKWAFAALGSVVTAVTQALYGWWKGHPDSIALVIGFAEVAIFVLGLVIVSTSKRGKAFRTMQASAKQDTPLNPSDNEELARLRRLEVGWKEQERWRVNRENLKLTGPYLSVTHTPGPDGFEHLAIRNIRKTEARHVKVTFVRVKENYELTSIPVELSFVDRNTRDDIKIKSVKNSFQEILKLPGRHWLVVDFEDEQHNHYMQEFETVVREDGSVEFLQPSELTLL
jgi:hypothetical protein